MLVYRIIAVVSPPRYLNHAACDRLTEWVQRMFEESDASTKLEDRLCWKMCVIETEHCRDGQFDMLYKEEMSEIDKGARDSKWFRFLGGGEGWEQYEDRKRRDWQKEAWPTTDGDYLDDAYANDAYADDEFDEV